MVHQNERFMATHRALNEKTDQTEWIHRLNCVFAGGIS